MARIKRSAAALSCLRFRGNLVEERGTRFSRQTEENAPWGEDRKTFRLPLRLPGDFFLRSTPPRGEKILCGLGVHCD